MGTLLNLIALILTWIFLPCFPSGQKPKQHNTFSIHYVLTVDANNLQGYLIEIHLHNAPPSFLLGMATHHEYDDRYWRFVKDFRVSGNASFIKTDSALWNITNAGKDLVITYGLLLPKTLRFAQQPFLSSFGGLLGDMHSFMYVVHHTDLPCTVQFRLPQDWQIATGLQKIEKVNFYYASSVKNLLDCPVLAGHLHLWNFKVKSVQHFVAYLAAKDPITFDSGLLVNNIKKIVLQNVSLYKEIPYHHYWFLIEDSVYGALEHSNSVTIGAPAGYLSSNMQEIYGELAHEFSHTWNLMRIKPSEYSALNYGEQEQSAGLWFSEGMAMYYSDVLRRRAKLFTEERERIKHLEHLITRYYTDTGNTVLPPSKVSLVSNSGPGKLGDFTASIHLQGELIGIMLDILLKKETKGKKSLDDVMRAMYRVYGKGKKGFTANGIENVVLSICKRPSVHVFFQKFVYDGLALDFNRYLPFIGLHMRLAFTDAVDNNGQQLPDTRVYVWKPAPDSFFHLIMTRPNNCWAKAGLHTGDVIVALGGKAIKTRQEFYDLLKTFYVGDSIKVQTANKTNTVILESYKTPSVHIAKLMAASNQEIKLYKLWEKAE